MPASVRSTAIALALLAASGIAASQARAFPSPSSAVAARAAADTPVRLAQLFGQRKDDSELVARMGRLENQIRQLTGMIEELQHRNSQLEQQLRRIQQDTEFRFQEMNPSARPPGQRGQNAPTLPPPSLPPAQRSQNAPIPPPPSLPPVASRSGAPVLIPPESPPTATQSGRRSDVFDPTLEPNAPGAPRTLGTLPGAVASAPGSGIPGTIDQPRRAPGNPLDLSPSSGPSLPPPGPGKLDPVQPPQRGGVGQQAVLAPSGSAKDEYDLAYGAILRRDYELAVTGFQTFLKHHANNREPEAQRLVPDAHYWLGESKFQLKQYNDAAELFLKISTDFPNAVKAPDALLRLGQSLVALGERETACASLGHVLTKYPKAPVTVRRAVEQEQKRARC